jgi:hypothetical protein
VKTKLKSYFKIVHLGSTDENNVAHKQEIMHMQGPRASFTSLQVIPIIVGRFDFRVTAVIMEITRKNLNFLNRNN